MSTYEVRCHSCNVSFPAGTKRCLHCGGRTGVAPAAILLQEDGRPALSAEAAEAMVEPGQGRSPFRIGLGLVWLVMALIASLARVCSG